MQFLFALRGHQAVDVFSYYISLSGLLGKCLNTQILRILPSAYWNVNSLDFESATDSRLNKQQMMACIPILLSFLSPKKANMLSILLFQKAFLL